MITDLKVAAMDAMVDVKDVVRDVTTTLPNEEPLDFQPTSQNIQAQEMSYLNNGWGQMQSQVAANRIDMTAEKMNFVLEMIQNGLIAFDAVEVELRGIAAGNTPPTPAQLIGIAGRIDANQKQIFMGLQKLRELSVELDRATDPLQKNSAQNSGWGTPNQGRRDWR